MDTATERADAALEPLMPALDSSCAAATALQWPERLAITGLLTPFDAPEDPVATEVLYDWTAPGQRTRIFPLPQRGATAQDALLLAAGGYTITHHRGRPPRCTAGLPGAIRPDWPSRAERPAPAKR